MKHHKIQCKPNPFRTSFVKGTRFTDTNVGCLSKWKQIELQQPGVPVPKHKFNTATISENGESLFIGYSPELLRASLDGTHNIQQRGKSSSMMDDGIFSRGNSIMLQNRNNALNNNHAASDEICNFKFEIGIWLFH